MIQSVFSGPSAEIRTQGLLNPIQARYQTSPHPGQAVRLADSGVILPWIRRNCKPFSKEINLRLWKEREMPPRIERSGIPFHSRRPGETEKPWTERPGRLGKNEAGFPSCGKECVPQRTWISLEPLDSVENLDSAEILDSAENGARIAGFRRFVFPGRSRDTGETGHGGLFRRGRPKRQGSPQRKSGDGGQTSALQVFRISGAVGPKSDAWLRTAARCRIRMYRLAGTVDRRLIGPCPQTAGEGWQDRPGGQDQGADKKKML